MILLWPLPVVFQVLLLLIFWVSSMGEFRVLVAAIGGLCDDTLHSTAVTCCGAPC